MPDSNIIEFSGVSFAYRTQNSEKPYVMALSGIDLAIERGKFTVVLGRNGSGKSTLARHMNALLQPARGVVIVDGFDTSNQELTWQIRHSVGMVFQNPDNQIVGTIVEEDVAFGPENLGVPSEEIRSRVDEALLIAGISEYAKHAPHLLSGGQKQRVAIAGILAMKPRCIVLDEATAMLDPVGRKEVMRVLSKLNEEDAITIVHITHHMDEASIADRVIVMDKGKMILSGSPAEVFRDVDRIHSIGLDVPQVTELFHELRNLGADLPDDVLTVDQAFEALKKIL